MSESTLQTLTVEDIDVELLREQRDALLDVIGDRPAGWRPLDLMDGIVHLLDYMLDVADGIR